MSEEEKDKPQSLAARAKKSAPKKKKPWAQWSTNKRTTVLVVSVAVLAVLAASFWVWHSQPSFCSFLCHSPQDNYVEDFYSGDEGLGVTTHANADMNCLSCHEATINLQLQEAIIWIGDGYTMTEDGYLIQDDVEASSEFCLRSGCHTWSAVVSSTEDWGDEEGFNPHVSHQDGSITCSDCHKIHKTSQMYCAKCHDTELPEGWEATSE